MPSELAPLGPSIIQDPVMNPFLLSCSSSNNRSDASPATGDKAETQSPAPRILVVDDEKVIADTIVQILNRNGFIAEAAYGGEEAIEKATRHCPELVLSDVLMPQVDGVEAAIAIRMHCPDTRIVLFSGQAATVEILARARERGHNFELLPKPIIPYSSSSTSASSPHSGACLGLSPGEGRNLRNLAAAVAPGGGCAMFGTPSAKILRKLRFPHFLVAHYERSTGNTMPPWRLPRRPLR